MNNFLLNRSDLTDTRFPPRLLSSVVFFVAVIAYGNSFPGVFFLDDISIVRDNPLVTHFNLIDILRSDYWHPHYGSGLFRPLTILSLAFNRMIFGPAAWGYHLVNVLLHGVTAVLLWQVLCRWKTGTVAALTAALFFALHPIHTEVVNEAVGRSELLVACLLLAGLLLYQKEGVAAQCGVALCYLLALCSKEHAIVFIVLLPVWVVFDSGIAGIRRRRVLWLALLALTVGWLLWRQFGVVNVLPVPALAEAASPLAFVDGMTRVLTALRIQGLYLEKLVTAVGLQAAYSPADIPFVRELFSIQGMATVVVVLTSVGLLLAGWRRHSHLALFALFFLVSFLPTSNLFFPIGVSMAERLAYTPSIWFCAALGVAVGKGFASSRWRAAVLFMAGGYLLWLGGMTWVRNQEFSSPEALWRAEVANNPNDFLAWQLLSSSLAAQGLDAEAEAGYRRMLALAPDYPGGLRRIVEYYLERGRFAEAQPYAEKVFAISRDENDQVAMAFDGLSLATIAVSVGEYGKALSYLDGPSRMLHDQVRAHEVRGLALSGLGRDKEAVESFSVIQLTPDRPGSMIAYGKSLLMIGQVAEARNRLEAGVKRVDDAEAWNLLGVACAQQQDWSSALTAFRRAVALQPRHRGYQENLLRVEREAQGSAALPRR